MKNKKAFTLSEILLAIVFVGVIAILVIPGMVKSINVRKNITAYQVAFDKVKKVLTEVEVMNSWESTGQEFWTKLDEKLSVIGYANPEDGENGSFIQGSSKADENKTGKTLGLDKLLPGAKWSYTRMDSFTGKTERIETILGNGDSGVAETGNGWSPWIIAENGMAFSVNTISRNKDGIVQEGDKEDIYTGLKNTCANSATMHNLAKKPKMDSLRNDAMQVACVIIMVDVNGLNKGPNKVAPYDAVEESKAQNIAGEYDRFMVFALQDGASAGPIGLTEYWMHKK